MLSHFPHTRVVNYTISLLISFEFDESLVVYENSEPTFLYIWSGIGLTVKNICRRSTLLLIVATALNPIKRQLSIYPALCNG